MTTDSILRDATPEDGEALAAIYNPYIRDTVITFATEEITGTQMGESIAKVQNAGLPWLVAEDPQEGAVLGYAYVGPFQERAAYRHSLEPTIYLSPEATGHGVGTALFSALIDRVRELPSWSEHAPAHGLYSRIALPNTASTTLHARFGFTQVGTFNEAGFKLGRWIDVGIFQLLLDS